ncbi:hypothetical protein P7K49_019544 [Saguinus oedipus]|uniref:Uncharacterized protein n=1 Tax=Saguinus oedipus TaxID=9490 RepID=A0ABQ9UXY5_SAGOE|nr:hypothetical protein P7K49_019544 [Saguinus oedipus]
MARSSQYLRQLQGPLLPPKDLVEEEEEEDDDYLRDDVEEDEDSVFVDAEELCSGGVKAGSLPGCIRGEEAPCPGDRASWRVQRRVSHSGFALSKTPVAANRLSFSMP